MATAQNSTMIVNYQKENLDTVNNLLATIYCKLLPPVSDHFLNKDFTFH